jgi:hypothetical protein
MFSTISIGVAILLMVVAIIAPANSVFPALASLAVCTLAIASAIQAGSTGRYVWLWGFVALAVLFNPFTVPGLPRMVLLGLTVATAAMFISWGALLARKTTAMSISQVLHPSDTK